VQPSSLIASFKGNRLNTSRHSDGFSMVEIMVGLVIGMLAMIIMMQVFALSEERKRNATSGGDAQNNGVIAFYQLQREITTAGYDIATTSVFHCNMVWPTSSTAVRLAPVLSIPMPSRPVTTILIPCSLPMAMMMGNLKAV